MGNAYDQLPNEGGKAFHAFNLYLNLGPDRSTVKVCETLSKSGALIRRWAAKYDWRERAQAYDTHLAGVEREAAALVVRGKASEWMTRRIEQRETEWKLRNQLLELAELEIAKRKNSKYTGTLEGIARLLELASKLGRLASGLPVAHTEDNDTEAVAIDLEWEMAMKKVYGEAANKIINI